MANQPLCALIHGTSRLDSQLVSVTILYIKILRAELCQNRERLPLFEWTMYTPVEIVTLNERQLRGGRRRQTDWNCMQPKRTVVLKAADLAPEEAVTLYERRTIPKNSVVVCFPVLGSRACIIV